MGILGSLGFSSFAGEKITFKKLFSLPVAEADFVRIEIETMFAKILTDVLERTEGVSDKIMPLLFDNCVQSETGDGLITLLAKAMTSKGELFLIYKGNLGTLREADGTESAKIREDYKKDGKSALGVFISFRNYKRTDMLKFYGMIEFSTIGGLYKQAKVSEALQFKMKELRTSVGLGDSEVAKVQAKDMSDALAAGQDILMDGGDEIVSPTPDLGPIKQSIDFLDAKRTTYLGMPRSYFSGEGQSGIGDSGNADQKAVERGLKGYYFAIVKPALKAIFGIETNFQSEQSDQTTLGLEAARSFELIGEEYISKENKLAIVNRLLNVKSKLGTEAPPPATPGRTPPGAGGDGGQA